MSSTPIGDNRYDMEPPADTAVLNAAADEESLVDLALEQLEPIGAGMSVAKTFIDFSDRYGNLGADRRADLATYFAGLGGAYAQIASDLRAGRSPDAGCATVQQYSQQLQRLFDGILTPEESLVLVGRLRALRSAERFRDGLERASAEGEAGRQYEMVRLEKAATLLGDLSRTVKGER